MKLNVEFGEWGKELVHESFYMDSHRTEEVTGAAFSTSYLSNVFIENNLLTP